MAFYFTVTSVLNNISVNSSGNNVQIASTTRPVTLYTGAGVNFGGGGITTSTTATITDLVIPADGKIEFLSTLTTATATLSIWERVNSPKVINVDGYIRIPTGAIQASFGQFPQLEIGPPDYGDICIQTDGGDVNIQRAGVSDGNLQVGGKISGFNGFYAGTLKVIDADGYWVGPAITDNPQEKINGITTTSQIQLDAFNLAQYDTAKYLIKIKDGSNLHIVEIVLAYDGTDILKSEYGVITNNGALGTFQADKPYGSDNVRLLFTPIDPTSMSVRVEKTLMAV